MEVEVVVGREVRVLSTEIAPPSELWWQLRGNSEISNHMSNHMPGDKSTILFLLVVVMSLLNTNCLSVPPLKEVSNCWHYVGSVGALCAPLHSHLSRKVG